MAPSCTIILQTVPACVAFNLRCSFLSEFSKSYRRMTRPIDIVLPSDTFHFRIFIGFVSGCVINTVFSAIFNGCGSNRVSTPTISLADLKRSVRDAPIECQRQEYLNMKHSLFWLQKDAIFIKMQWKFGFGDVCFHFPRVRI